MVAIDSATGSNAGPGLHAIGTLDRVPWKGIGGIELLTPLVVPWSVTVMMYPVAGCQPLGWRRARDGAASDFR
jgi:hypothetical protein